MEEINFLINQELFTLNIPLEEQETILDLQNSDFARQYTFNLINNGFISMADPLESILRITDESQIQIYPVDEEHAPETLSFSNENDVKKIEWTQEETKMALDLYEEYVSRVGPMKKFKKKKNMWEQIARDLNGFFKINRTAVQVENRYKTVLKRKKAAVENNSRSGSSRMDVPFQDELNKIAAMDDSIEPEVLGSANEIKILKPSGSTAGSFAKPSTSGTTRIKKQTLGETLRDIHKEKEEARERRHKEKLDLLKEIFSNK